MMRKPSKPKPAKQSLVEELSEPLRDFVADFKTHGKSALETVRERSPEKYLELSTKLLPLVAALNPGADDWSDCKDLRDIGIKLLKSVGMSEFDMTEDAIEEAMAANDRLIEGLQQIRARAEGQLQ